MSKKFLLSIIVFIFFIPHNYRPVNAQDNITSITIWPSGILTLRNEENNRIYKTSFAVWPKEVSNWDAQPSIRFAIKNFDLKNGDASILADNISVISIRPSGLEETAEELRFPLRYNILVELPDNIPYPRGEYNGELLVFYGDNAEHETITLKLTHDAVPFLELENPVPIRLNSNINDTVTYTLSLREITGAIDADEIKVASHFFTSVEEGSRFLPSNIITPTNNLDLVPSGERENIELGFDFTVNGIKPGAYKGNLFISSAHSNELIVPVELNLKDGLFWPTLVLGISISVGFLFNLYTTKRQEKDVLLTRIRREKAILDDPSIKVGSVNAAFYEMYASEIRQQLGWAEDELSKDEYNIDVAKRAFAKIASFKNLSRTDRSLFKDLLNLKRDIDLLIKSVSPLIGENNQYLYIEHAQKDLLNKQENLPNIQTQGEFQELYNDFESQSEMLKMFRQCLTMINVLKGTLLQEVEEKDKNTQNKINDFMIRISDNENQLISAGDLITKEDLEIISKSIKEIEDEVSQEIGHPINKDLNSTQVSGGEEILGQDYVIDWEGQFEFENNSKKRIRVLIENYSPDVRLSTYRFSLTVITLSVLGYLGLSELYLNDLTFGDTRAIDYMSLVIWGIGANATQEGIFQLLGRISSRLQLNYNP